MFDSIVAYLTGWFPVLDSQTTIRDGQRIRVTIRPSVVALLDIARAWLLSNSFKVNGGTVSAENVIIENEKLIVTGIFKAQQAGQSASVQGWVGLSIAVALAVGFFFQVEKVELALEEGGVLVARLTVFVIVLAIIWKLVLKR